MVNALLGLGADATTEGQNGTAMDIAQASQNSEIIEALSECNSSPDRPRKLTIVVDSDETTEDTISDLSMDASRDESIGSDIIKTSPESSEDTPTKKRRTNKIHAHKDHDGDTARGEEDTPDTSGNTEKKEVQGTNNGEEEGDKKKRKKAKKEEREGKKRRKKEGEKEAKRGEKKAKKKLKRKKKKTTQLTSPLVKGVAGGSTIRERRPPAHLHARNGDWAGLVKLIKQQGIHAVMTARDARGQTVLHVAIDSGQTELIGRLLTYYPDRIEADLNIQDRNGWSALHSAASLGEIDVLLLLLSSRRFDAALVSTDGSTPLHYLIRRFPDTSLKASAEAIEVEKFCRAVRILIDSGANIRAVNLNQETVLHSAAMAGSAAAVLWLINNEKWSFSASAQTKYAQRGRGEERGDTSL